MDTRKPTISSEFAEKLLRYGLLTPLVRKKLKISESKPSTLPIPGTTDKLKPTISSENAKILMREGLLTPIVRNKRKISSLLLSSSRSTISSLIIRKSMASRQDWIKIPAFLTSADTFAFIGYSGSMAPKLWTHYVWHCRNEVAVDRLGSDFFDFVRSHTEDSGVPDVSHSMDYWRGCLGELGVNERLTEAILDPDYKDVRLTATCKFWVIDSMHTEYKALQSLDKKLTRLVTLIQQWRDLECLSFPGPAVKAPLTMKGHTMLWRADSRSRIKYFYIGKDINLEAIESSCGDFSYKEPLTYWTPQKETAERYAEWARHRQRIADIELIQVAVPDAFMKTLSNKKLFDQGRVTDEWRKLILSTRKRQERPPELEYLKERDVIGGHISSGRRARYELITDYTQISPSDVLIVEINGLREDACQYAFNTRKAQEGFEKHCRRKIWSHSLEHDEQ